jgi:hypothetical protein
MTLKRDTEKIQMMETFSFSFFDFTQDLHTKKRRRKVFCLVGKLYTNVQTYYVNYTHRARVIERERERERTKNERKKQNNTKVVAKGNFFSCFYSYMLPRVSFSLVKKNKFFLFLASYTNIHSPKDPTSPCNII